MQRKARSLPYKATTSVHAQHCRYLQGKAVKRLAKRSSTLRAQGPDSRSDSFDEAYDLILLCGALTTVFSIQK
jgi:hypothetical protein